MATKFIDFESGVRAPITLKRCQHCGKELSGENFSPSNSFFHKDRYSPFCNDCMNLFILKGGVLNWENLDRVCQFLDIPFVPAELTRLLEEAKPREIFPLYALIMQNQEYARLHWDDLQKQYQDLDQTNSLKETIPVFKEQELRELKQKWGANYSEEQLFYLENLYNGTLLTQNVNGALQHDQALKLCKISLEVDEKIREGSDFDKLLASYDKLVKIAEFTPKNVKNANDFDSIGELVKWLEKKGWKNGFYDGVKRDIVDETIKNIQSANQYLYVNESGIGDEITNRLEQLKQVKEMENTYDTQVQFDPDKYEVKGFNDIMSLEEFKADL